VNYGFARTQEAAVIQGSCGLVNYGFARTGREPETDLLAAAARIASAGRIDLHRHIRCPDAVQSVMTRSVMTGVLASARRRLGVHAHLALCCGQVLAPRVAG
jgi:hypothetical protein